MALNHLKSATMGVLLFLIMWCTAQGVPEDICYHTQPFPYCYQGICYQLSENKLDFNLSISYCKKIGGVLASIHSFEQNEFIWNSICDEEDCWIGLHDPDRVGSWEWVDGSEYDYEHWWRQRDIRYESFGVAIVDYQSGINDVNIGEWLNQPKSKWFRAACMRSTPPTSSPTLSTSTTDAPTLSPSTINTGMQSEESVCVERTEIFIFLSVISLMLIFQMVLIVCVFYRQTFTQRQASIELGEQTAMPGGL